MRKLTRATLTFMSAVAAYLTCVCHGTSYPKLYTLDNSCGSSILVEGEARIVLTNDSHLHTQVCAVSLWPSHGSRLIASVSSYHLSHAYTTPSCLHTSIQLGSQHDPQLWGPFGYCKHDGPSGKYSLGTRGAFSYKTDPSEDIVVGDIELLVTEVFERDQTGHCQSHQFDCQRDSICIDESLTCNGFDDCGNERDEQLSCNKSLAFIGGIVVAAVVGVVLVVVLVLVICRQRLKNRYVHLTEL
ncbi:uncharacterized protein LOC131937407 [Physella acuta]|uniref:uncharacterized protein LOC131937407 n=1 Tax=Physella acuta TaxID=109671 RepID=UPI0027DBD98B|nr:uncharacterized protein LOC131937407 [Physella acuta]